MVLLRHKSSHMTDYMFSFKMILLSHFISDLRIIQESVYFYRIGNKIIIAFFNNFFSVIAFCCGFSTCISFCDICCQSASAEKLQWKLPVLCNACSMCVIDTYGNVIYFCCMQSINSKCTIMCLNNLILWMLGKQFLHIFQVQWIFSRIQPRSMINLSSHSLNFIVIGSRLRLIT